MKKILNPSTNKLNPGISMSDLSKAIKNSGYPLQMEVANILKKRFYVRHEWSFIDEDTNNLRTIDLIADKEYWTKYRIQPHLRAHLNLLIECKKSETPYVFFLLDGQPWMPYFPLISGLRNDNITVATDDDPSTWIEPMSSALGLRKHKFVSEVPFCTTFTKIESSGRKILSGDDPFNNLVQPLLKSMKYFKKTEIPSKTALYFDCGIVLGVGVIDAPMVGIKITGKKKNISFIPWVTVIRHESNRIQDNHQKENIFSIDIIHKDFLEEYLNSHVLPFASYFEKVVMKHQEEIISGRGFVSGMGKNWYSDIEKRLLPQTIKEKIKRIKAVPGRIIAKN